MATKKTAKKGAKRAGRKTAAASRARGRNVKKAATKSGPRKRPHATAKGRTARGGKAKGALRVRMYRIGFGDFFLLTVPTEKHGPQHILIDCGVHAGNIGTMDECVKNLIEETDRKLALVIATHYHADHLSGFASNYDDFAEFEVGAVWITNRLDPKKKDAANLHQQIKSLANQLRLGLRLRLGLNEGEEPGRDVDLAQAQALYKAENALGVQLGAAGSSNEKALQLLREGFKNKPPVYYYQGGDEPVLPGVLKGRSRRNCSGPRRKTRAESSPGRTTRRNSTSRPSGKSGSPRRSA